MTYSVKEIFYTLQGEGTHAGRAAVFLRFAGCNLWSGRTADRASGPGSCSAWCDTDFLGTNGARGGRYEHAAELADRVAECWITRSSGPFVVCTGGEPLLQLDRPLIDALHGRGFEIAVETNGTIPLPIGIDWVCVSPKAGASLLVTSGNELKLVYPQAGLDPESLAGLDFDRLYLQPMDGPNSRSNAARAVEYCLAHPRWRLSLQTHKVVGLP